MGQTKEERLHYSSWWLDCFWERGRISHTNEKFITSEHTFLIRIVFWAWRTWSVTSSIRVPTFSMITKRKRLSPSPTLASLLKILLRIVLFKQLPRTILNFQILIIWVMHTKITLFITLVFEISYSQLLRKKIKNLSRLNRWLIIIAGCKVNLYNM